MSPEVALFFISSLLSVADDDDDGQVFFDTAAQFEWYVFPIVNPDGYDFTRKQVRKKIIIYLLTNFTRAIQPKLDLSCFENQQKSASDEWRKNRSKYSYACFGVNLQRNFPYIGEHIIRSKQPRSPLL